jgi:hypothetical protein
MNSVIQPPVDPREPGPSADDLDGLLRDFYQAEMPSVWPGFQRPAPRRLLAAPWRARFRSTLALAASLVILALSLGLLSGKIAVRAPSVMPGSDPAGANVKPGQDNHRHGPIQPDK